MKSAFLILTACFSLASTISSFGQAPGKINPGDKLPEMNTELKNVDGKMVSFHKAMDKNGLLVMFSCNTCPFVVKNEPVTKKVMAYAAAHKVGMVVINSNEAKRDGDDSYEEMKKYSKKQGLTVPYLTDNNANMADIFGANHTPEVFLFDGSGKLIYKGAMNDNPSDPSGYKKMYIFDAIDAAVAGKEMNPSATKSIGCSIKRKV
ncbi:MAG: redoxin family protein [Taibaiella sp.]|nr:redoxin family protein [Taibaiella sp.]